MIKRLYRIISKSGKEYLTSKFSEVPKTPFTKANVSKISVDKDTRFFVFYESKYRTFSAPREWLGSMKASELYESLMLGKRANA